MSKNVPLNSMKKLRIATRQSRLALWQAEHVAARLRAAHADLEVVLVPMTTQGDRVLDRSLATVGGKGLFVKELETAMLEDRADIAVHSMKDVPSVLPPGMCLSAMLERADARDAFVSNRYANFASLPQGARVGTSSLRRQCQLLAARPDLNIQPLRGNVETRLRKLDAGDFDAIVLAAAGLERLELARRITEKMDIDRSIPAVGQGIVGIECREDDRITFSLCAALKDADAESCAAAERAFAARLDGGCQSPIAAHATLQGSELRLIGLVAATDGGRVIRDVITGPRAEAATLGTRLAERVLAAGADVLLQELRGEST
jgi:hydroxymethylbilane synthase